MFIHKSSTVFHVHLVFLFDIGDEGILNGIWGGDELNEVSAIVEVPANSVSATLRLRYWALDSWDAGEAAAVSVDGTELWSLERDNYGSSCDPFLLYEGAANIPDAWSGENSAAGIVVSKGHKFCLCFHTSLITHIMV